MQNMVWAPAILTVLTAVANVPINMLLIAWHGFWGAALATSVARILQLLLLCGEQTNFLPGAGKFSASARLLKPTVAECLDEFTSTISCAIVSLLKVER